MINQTNACVITRLFVIT